MFRSWLPLAPCLINLFLFMISLLAAVVALIVKLVSLHWLSLPPCLISLSLFMISLLIAAAALFPKLNSLHGFAFGCRCRLVSQACFPS